LAALIDGEGCVSYTATPATNSVRRGVIVTNTDIDIIEACTAACDMLDVRYTVRWRAMDAHRRKPICNVCIGGDQLAHLAEVVTLRSARKQSRLVEGASYQAQRRLVRREDWPLDDVRRLYVDEGLTQSQVGERLGVGQTTVARWMDAAGLKRRPARKTHCLYGHELKDPNLYYNKNGSRRCRRCAIYRATAR
jgi:hypothetical protein